jgi:hypothetical protein
MPLLPRLRSLVASWFSRDRLEKDLDAELGAVLEQLTAEKVAAGMSPDVAAREARLEVGGVEVVKEEVRAVRAAPRWRPSCVTSASGCAASRARRG